MVSPISIPGFPSVHTRHSAATCDAALESRLASLEACVTTLPSLITAVIDQAFANSLTQFRRDMFFRGAGEGISTPLAGNHHGSPAIDPIQLPRSPICAEGAQSQLSPSAVRAPPLLSSSPLLRALATSAVKPNSKDSAAATVLLPKSKRAIHASTMTSAPRLLHEHSFSDTTQNGPEDFCAWNLFDVIPDSSYYDVLDRDMCYCNGIRDKGGGSTIRPLEDCRMRLGEKIAQSDDIGYFIKKKLHVWYQLPSGLWKLGMVRGHGGLILFGTIACYTGHNAIVYHVFLNAKYGWVNWYLVGKFVKKNFYALHLFDEMSKKHNMENMSLSSNMEALDVVVLAYRSWPKDLAASFTEEIGTLGHINAIKQFLCLSLLQIFLQLGWCHTLTDPCDNISYQGVVFNKRNNTKWLMEKPYILSFMIVEENGKRKAFGFVASIFRLLEESANLKGLQDGHVGQEQDMFAILSCKHINDPFQIKAEFFPCNFQKLPPIVLCLPLVIKQDNAWNIAILFCDVAQDTIVLQFLLELLSVGNASVGIVLGERATNGNVPDIRTWAILFEDHCFMVDEMLYLAEMDQHFPDDAYLSDALPLNPRKSLIAQSSYFKKVISMVTNSLTSSLNLEIEVKLLFQENGTTTASIILFLFHGMLSKERGKSGTKEALQFVAETTQQCGTVNAVRQYLWLFEEFPPKVVYSYVDSFHFRGRGFDERFAGKFKEKYKIDVFQNARACLHLCTACEMLKKVDPLPCDILRFEYQWHVPSHQNAWKLITKEGSYNGKFRGQFHFVFIVANKTSVFNTKAEIALKENFATIATLLVAARFKQVPTVSFLSLEDKANFQGGNIVMNPICD